jgi:hypothetical protein
LDAHDGACNPLIGVARAVCEAPLFSVSQLAALGVDVANVLRLATSLCDTGGVTASHAEVVGNVEVVSRISEAKGPVRPDGVNSWQAVAARLSELPARPAIERSIVVPGVVLVDNRDGVFVLSGPFGVLCHSRRILLDSCA